MESFQGLSKDGEKLVGRLAVHGTGGGNLADFITACAPIQADVAYKLGGKDASCSDWRVD